MNLHKKRVVLLALLLAGMVMIPMVDSRDQLCGTGRNRGSCAPDATAIQVATS